MHLIHGGLTSLCNLMALLPIACGSGRSFKRVCCAGSPGSQRVRRPRSANAKRLRLGFLILTPEYNCARIKLTVPRTGCTLCELKFSSHTGGSHDQEQDSEYNTRIVSAREVHSRHRHHPGNSQEYGAQVSAPSGTGGHASSAT